MANEPKRQPVNEHLLYLYNEYLAGDMSHVIIIFGQKVDHNNSVNSLWLYQAIPTCATTKAQLAMITCRLGTPRK